MADSERLKFSEILSSRLCHDLITPVGAINTGLELLSEQDDPQSEEAQEIWTLIQHSAQTSSNRLGFFRIAFGSSGCNLSLGDAKHLVERYFEKGKIQFNWPADMDPQVAIPGWARLMLNSVLWMSECAPRGGTIHIRPPLKNSESLEVKLETPHISFHEGTVEALKGDMPFSDLTPRTVQSSLLRLLAHKMGYKISLDDKQPEALTLKIS